MGQRQLLLIALAFILVGIAVIVGLYQFSTSAAQSNRDLLYSDLNFISALARAHFKKSDDMGGGGSTFANFNIPVCLLETANGTFEHTQTGHNTDHIHFAATGTELGEDGVNPIAIEVKITTSETEFKVNN
jgi:hypothetical protein